MTGIEKGVIGISLQKLFIILINIFDRLVNQSEQPQVHARLRQAEADCPLLVI